MQVRGIQGEAIHKPFPLTLGRTVVIWLRTLPRNSIHFLQQLAHTVAQFFQVMAVSQKGVSILWTMTQGQIETLRSYIEMYHTIVLNVETYQFREALESLKNGLQCNRRDNFKPASTKEDAPEKTSRVAQLYSVAEITAFKVSMEQRFAAIKENEVISGLTRKY